MKAFVIRSLALAAVLAGIAGCSALARDDGQYDSAGAGRTGASRNGSNLDDFFHRNDETGAHNSAL
jgi:hypothetical protein